MAEKCISPFFRMFLVGKVGLGTAKSNLLKMKASRRSSRNILCIYPCEVQMLNQFTGQLNESFLFPPCTNFCLFKWIVHHTCPLLHCLCLLDASAVGIPCAMSSYSFIQSWLYLCLVLKMTRCRAHVFISGRLFFRLYKV